MENLDAFLQQNAEHLTIPDMAEETGLPQDQIRHRCNQLRISPIKLMDQAIQFVIERCEKLTPEEISAASGKYSLKYLRKVYDEIGISFRRQFGPVSYRSKKKPKQVLKSVPTILFPPPEPEKVALINNEKEKAVPRRNSPREILGRFQQPGVPHIHMYLENNKR